MIPVDTIRARGMGIKYEATGDMRGYRQRWEDERANHREAVAELTYLLRERTTQRNVAWWLAALMSVVLLAVVIGGAR